jgi:hypothetical protein
LQFYIVEFTERGHSALDEQIQAGPEDAGVRQQRDRIRGMPTIPAAAARRKGRK